MVHEVSTKGTAPPTSQVGPASAYAAVLAEIDTKMGGLIKTHPAYFTFKKPADGTVDNTRFPNDWRRRFCKGLPKQDIGGHRVQVKEDYRRECTKAVDQLAQNLG